MKEPSAESRVTAFLKGALADEPVDVPELEAMARVAGLLGEQQRLANAKPFRKAKSALGIQSVRDGFGPDGTWRWKLPRDREGPTPLSREVSAASSIKRPPVRAERRIPLDWTEGVDRLDFQRPMTGVPRHRWRRFVNDVTAS